MHLRLVLVRHGRPQIDYSERIAGSQLAQWTQRYDDAPLDLSYPPPESLLHLAEFVRYVVTSPLRRSFESAQIVAPKVEHYVCSQVREAGLPTPKSIPLILPARTWSTIARFAWFVGWSAQAESLQQASHRAESATMELANLAKQHGSVLLLGHGIINLLIAKNLLASGWEGAKFPAGGHWGFSEYLLPVSRYN